MTIFEHSLLQYFYMLDSTIKNILFDLDGTLIEPQEGIINSILYSLKKLGIDDNDREALKSFIGPPLIDSYRERYDFDEEEVEKKSVSIDRLDIFSILLLIGAACLGAYLHKHTGNEKVDIYQK